MERYGLSDCVKCKLALILILLPRLFILVPGIDCSKQTDDVGVFGSALSNEFSLIAEHFSLDSQEICDLARGAIDVIFGSEQDKDRLRTLMWDGIDA